MAHARRPALTLPACAGQDRQDDKRHWCCARCVNFLAGARHHACQRLVTRRTQWVYKAAARAHQAGVPPRSPPPPARALKFQGLPVSALATRPDPRAKQAFCLRPSLAACAGPAPPHRPALPCPAPHGQPCSTRGHGCPCPGQFHLAQASRHPRRSCHTCHPGCRAARGSAHVAVSRTPPLGCPSIRSTRSCCCAGTSLQRSTSRSVST